MAYAVWSPSDAHEAADAMLKLLKQLTLKAMRNAERYPFTVADSALGEAGLQPYYRLC